MKVIKKPAEPVPPPPSMYDLMDLSEKEYTVLVALLGKAVDRMAEFSPAAAKAIESIYEAAQHQAWIAWTSDADAYGVYMTMAEKED